MRDTRIHSPILLNRFTALLLAILVSLSTAGPACSQGTVLLNNLVIADSIDAPIFDLSVILGTKLGGSSFLAQLYAGPVGTTEDKLVPTGLAVDFKTGAAAGYLNVGVNGSRTVAGVPAGANAVVQIRAWTAGTGSTYEEAAVSSNPASRIGHSNVLTVQTQPGVFAQAVGMIGLQSFAIVPVPEPSLLFLGALGAAILLLRSQRKS